MVGDLVVYEPKDNSFQNMIGVVIHHTEMRAEATVRKVDETTSLSFTKQWNDDGNVSGKRPDVSSYAKSLTLLADGEEQSGYVAEITDNGDNTYKKELKKFNNLKAYVKLISPQHINIEIRAEYYMEPHSRYLIQIDNNKNEVTWRLPDFSEYISGFNKQISFTNGVHNCILIEINGATSPNFPVVVDLIATNNNQLKFLSVFHATSRKNFESIPMNFNGTDLEKLNQVK